MVNFFHLASLVSLAFGAVATCHRYAVDVQAFPEVGCIGHNVRKAFKAKEGKCRDSHFKDFAAKGLRITSHGRNVDEESRACRLYWYELDDCEGARGTSDDLHHDGSFKCYNTTLNGHGFHSVGVRSVRLHCDERGQKFYPAGSVETKTTRCTKTRTVPTVKAPTSSTSTTRTVVSTERVSVVVPVTRTQFATITRSVNQSSSSSSLATETIESTSTVVAPTATIEGTTTVWVTSSSSSSSTMESSTSTTTLSSESVTPSTTTIVSSAASTITTTVTPSSSSSSTQHSTRTATWVATITDAAKMKIARRFNGNIPCYVSIDGRWSVSSCSDAAKTTKTTSASG